MAARRVYLTGDTAYHEVLAAAVGPHRPDILLAVINGAFRNLSPADAARLAKQLEVKVAIPCHYDLFPDNSLPPELFRTTLKIEVPAPATCGWSTAYRIRFRVPRSTRLPARREKVGRNKSAQFRQKFSMRSGSWQCRNCADLFRPTSSPCVLA